jgi:predicted dehydrogenase
MTLRVGVVGAGWVGTVRHVPSYLSNPAVGTVTIYDRLPARAARAATNGALAWAGDFDGFLDQGFDILSICTSPWSHADLTIAALEHGAHVLTEKPMAMNAGEARAMVAASELSGRLLCVAHNFLFSSAVQEADQLLGRAGELQYGMATQLSSERRRLPTWYRELPAGLFFDELPHMLYTLRHFLGDLTLDSLRATYLPDGHPHTVEVNIRGATTAQLVTVFGSPVSEWHVNLIGDSGVIDLDLFRDFATYVGSDGPHGAFDILRSSARASAGHWRGFASSGLRLVRHRESWGHQQLIDTFVDAVLGFRPTPVPLSDSLNVVELTDLMLGELA